MTKAVAFGCAAWLLAGPALSAGKVPRDAYGRPDFEGLWTNATETPIERPASFSGPITGDAEAAAFEKASAAAFANDGDVVGSRQSEWWERGAPMVRIDGHFRTSLIVEPADGKLPYSEAGRRLLTASQAAVFADFRGPESRPGPERCLMGGSGTTGAPILPGNYTSIQQFVQTADHLAIASEAMHAVRIIPLGSRRAAPVEPRRWAGNSVGWWQGEMLVVETRGFVAGEQFKPPAAPYISQDAVVTERFSRLRTGEILYEFSVDDPTAYSSPWRGQSLFRPSKGPMFEFACHEGNYSLEGVLAGARQAEEAGK